MSDTEIATFGLQEGAGVTFLSVRDVNGWRERLVREEKHQQLDDRAASGHQKREQLTLQEVMRREYCPKQRERGIHGTSFARAMARSGIGARNAAVAAEEQHIAALHRRARIVEQEAERRAQPQFRPQSQGLIQWRSTPAIRSWGSPRPMSVEGNDQVHRQTHREVDRAMRRPTFGQQKEAHRTRHTHTDMWKLQNAAQARGTYW